MDRAVLPDALIFDCDGTLADTMPAHYEAWQATLAPLGLSLDEDRFYAMGGWPTTKVAAWVAATTGRPLDLPELCEAKEAAFARMIPHVRPIGPVVEIAERHRGRLPLAVATGAVRPILLRILKQIGVEGWFDALVSAEDVARHKPEPDTFLEAARRLGVDPVRCRVYEDTEPGLEAARRAGMACVDIRPWHTPRRVTPVGSPSPALSQPTTAP